MAQFSTGAVTVLLKGLQGKEVDFKISLDSMSVSRTLLLTLALLCGSALAAQKSYDGSVVLRTEPLTEVQADAVRNLMVTTVIFDFWKDPQIGLSCEIRADKDDIPELKAFLGKHNIEYTVKIADVGALMREVEASRPAVKSPKLTWDDYSTYDEIVQFLEETAASYTWVETESIGQTYEGRDMVLLKTTKAGSGAPTIWIDAGIHAREWIAPAVATFMINEIITNYDSYADYFNFYFLPVANPDGYEYSWSDDRLWRKTRSVNSGSVCIGTDPNRNWDWHWGETGASSSPCSDSYKGSAIFSEIETTNMKNYIESISPTPVLFSALHSAAELWLWPYGWSTTAFADNYEEQDAAGQDAVAALEAVHGIKFVCEHSASLYEAAGDANDWYYGAMGATYAYTVELRDQGFGFILPPGQIIPSGEETMAAFLSLFDRIMNAS